jgi:hypothetical protein
MQYQEKFAYINQILSKFDDEVRELFGNIDANYHLIANLYDVLNDVYGSDIAVMSTSFDREDTSFQILADLQSQFNDATASIAPDVREIIRVNLSQADNIFNLLGALKNIEPVHIEAIQTVISDRTLTIEPLSGLIKEYKTDILFFINIYRQSLADDFAFPAIVDA